MAPRPTRTDAHRPSAPDFNPEAYRCIGVFYFGNDGPSDRKEAAKLINHLVQQGYHSGHGNSNNCGHCGAFTQYSALMVRDDIKQFIYVGETCLNNRFELTTTQFQTLRKNHALHRTRTRKAERIAATLEQLPWLDELAPHDTFLNDLLMRLHGTGELTERQIEAAINAEPRVRQRIEQKTQRQAEKTALIEAGIKAPEGRTDITGEIVSIKEQETQFGTVYKMLVKTTEGWCVWSTIPRALADVQRGEIITFTATLTRSDNDPLFALAKNPTVKAKK